MKKGKKRLKATHGTAGSKRKGFESGNPYRWQPGQSGNPAGRPVRSDILAEALDGILLEPSTRDVKKSKLEAIVRKAVRMAETGNLRAIEYLWDRKEGRPKQTVHVWNDQEAAWAEWLNKYVSGIELETNGDSQGIPADAAPPADPGGGGTLREDGVEQPSVLPSGTSESKPE